MSMDRSLIESFLEGVAKTRALVVGDLMLDEYIWGAVDRISPEAPVQIVEVQRKDLRLGGAGNVINNLLTLNCQVDVVRIVSGENLPDSRVGCSNNVELTRLLPLALRPAVGNAGIDVFTFHERQGLRVTEIVTRAMEDITNGRERKSLFSDLYSA